MKLSKQERAELREMFGGKCAYCGTALGDKWHGDHVQPVKRDWEFVRLPDGNLKTINGIAVTRATGKLFNPENDNKANIYPACAPCNIDKGCMPMEEWRDYLSQRILVGLRRNSSTFRHAERFGLITLATPPLMFWFEKYAKEPSR